MSQTMPPQSEDSEVSKRSCVRCNRRKVRCDRKQPCAQCLQANAECIHPGNKRAPRKLNRPPIAALRTRLQQLEEEVERLQAADGRSAVGSRAAHEAERPMPVDTKPLHGMLVVQDETKSRYVADDAFVFLRNKIPGLQELYRQSWDKGHSSNSELGLDAGRSDPLQPLQMEMLWPVYKSNVAHVVTILHTSSVESVIRQACVNPYVELDPESDALIRAVFFAAVVSMDPAHCWSVVGDERDVCLREFRLAVERSLAKANLVCSDDIRVLQAAVLYLLCLRCVCDSKQIWVEAAVVVRVAQRQGIHRDGQNLGLSPFDIEMRRRLWSHICILDILCSEDQGTDTQIRPEMFDTEPPLNIDSDDLSPTLTELPSPQAGFTDITLCIIQYEIMAHISWTDKSFGSGSNQSHLQSERSSLPELAASLEERYLQKFDLRIPIQWVTAVIFRLTLSKASLVNHLSNSAALDQESTATDDEIFILAVEILKFSSLLQNNEITTPWAWLCRSYKQEHAMALILSELCSRPISPETDHAWDLVKAVYDQWQADNKINSQMQEPVSLLMERASISRKNRAGALWGAAE
ncbi:hypothetical protein P170DRAFT_161050 [Aspergillus steynii IBT 23096]|uniref:Zn(2)-C6 fungal-type domain-containing protein n=1 Tax=Aspergillus steynii IBT 23096 TaxID=1392250 RepID=A0A2I2GE28_9EURO|nr:uncharacterized protein P170DRAFT_161050 [Aspergillus steynii IBT 23096]PLB51145.1 hypothetical protein P170DRAFT_161050 [Aspergillus steynii IBT 23096]